MDSLIRISSPEQQLRQNRTLWISAGTVGSIAGLLLWSASPFALPNTKNKVDVILRYIALAGSLASGVVVVVAGNQLQRIAPLLRAVEMAEKQDFLTQLAASQYQQQQHWEHQAQQPLFREQLPKSYENPNSRTPHPERVPEKLDNSLTDNLTPSNTPIFDSYKPTYLMVRTLQQQGVPDSRIIKEHLGYAGDNYPEGRKAFDTLLQLGTQQQWDKE